MSYEDIFRLILQKEFYNQEHLPNSFTLLQTKFIEILSITFNIFQTNNLETYFPEKYIANRKYHLTIYYIINSLLFVQKVFNQKSSILEFLEIIDKLNNTVKRISKVIFASRFTFHESHFTGAHV